MPWINTVDEESADKKEKQIYEEIKNKRGKISNIMQVQSLNPKAMKKHLELYYTIMFSDSSLQREECEMIATVVSAVNKCEYCINHHAEALNHYWKNQSKLKKFMQDYNSIELNKKERCMLDYAVKLTEKAKTVSEQDIKNLKDNGFNDKDILNINLVVSYFNFVNRIAIGLGVEFDPKEMSGYKY